MADQQKCDCGKEANYHIGGGKYQGWYCDEHWMVILDKQGDYYGREKE